MIKFCMFSLSVSFTVHLGPKCSTRMVPKCLVAEVSGSPSCATNVVLVGIFNPPRLRRFSTNHHETLNTRTYS